METKFTHEDEGYAFPTVNPRFDGNWDKNHGSRGMTLRQFYAAHALSGFVSHVNNMKAINPEKLEPCLVVAELAFKFADAMIAAEKDTQS